MKVMICDDEPLARERLVRLTAQLGHEVIAQASNGHQAISLLKQFQPDVILLDIRMPEMSGINCAELISQLTVPPAIIFCTAYDEFALPAYKASASDYLLKPISLDALSDALNKVVKITQAQLKALQVEAPTKSPFRQHISARSHRGIELIAVEDIYYFFADQKYVMVRHKHGQVLIDDTLKELEQEFAEGFIRLHRNALVSLKYLDGIELVEGGQYRARCKEIDDRLLISRRHLSTIKCKMQQL